MKKKKWRIDYKKIMKSEDYLSRDEILDYVFNDVKPNNIKNKSKTPVTKRDQGQEFEKNNKSENDLDNYNNEKFENIDEKKLI